LCPRHQWPGPAESASQNFLCGEETNLPRFGGVSFCLLVSRPIRANALIGRDWRIRAGGRLRGPKSEFKLKVSFVQKLLRVSFFGLITTDMQTNIKSYVAEAVF
jgi:hypothetical protein